MCDFGVLHFCNRTGEQRRRNKKNMSAHKILVLIAKANSEGEPVLICADPEGFVTEGVHF